MLPWWLLSFVVAAAVIAVTIFFWNGAGVTLISKKGDAIVLLGPMGAGKTALFHRLSQGVFRRTVRSVKSNRASTTVKLNGDTDPGLKTMLIDLPGHGSQRYQLADVLCSARAVVFLIDASCDEQQQDLADFLYAVLASPTVVNANVPVFIGLNKSDKTESHTIEFFKKLLEQHIQRIRMAQGDMDDIGGGTQNKANVMIGHPDLPFSFEDYQCPLEFGRISVKNDDLSALHEFLRTRVQ